MDQSKNYIRGKDFNGNYFKDISNSIKKKYTKCYKIELSRVKNKWINEIKIKDKNNGNLVNAEYTEKLKIIKFKN